MSGRDIISNLPDEIIGKILSQLPTRLAASTSVLSKRWRNLLALVDNLDFDDATVGGRRPQDLGFPEFVEKTILLLSTTSCPTWNRFSLKFKFRQDDSLVKSWIRTALERGCLELHLENIGWFNIPIPYFTSNTLVKLTISKGIYATHRCHEDSWGRIFPSLKSLSIVAMAFPDFETYHFLINGCPVLEDLSLHYHEDLNPPNWSGGVLCPSIKRMKIYHYFPSHRKAHDDVLFDTPNLVYLDYSSYVADEYEVYLGSLVEARLDLLSWERLNDKGGHADNDDDDNYSDCSCGCCDDDNDNASQEDEEAASGDYEDYWEMGDYVLGDATNLVAGISNIKTLHLSPDSLEGSFFFVLF